MTKPLFFGGLILGFAWPLFRLIFADGWVLDDEISHWLFSAQSWQDKKILLDLWTRPGRNLIHFPIAGFGLTASRIYTLALAGLGFFFTFKLAQKLGLKTLWALPILFCFQAWFPELSFPVLTQTPFLFVWIVAIYWAISGLESKGWRWHAAGFCFGYVSLIRHEGILLTGLWGLWMSFQAGGFLHSLLKIPQLRKRKESLFPFLGKRFIHDACFGCSTILPIFILNLATYLNTKEIPFTLYFESKPTEMYGRGSLFHYFPLLVSGVGLFSFLLGVLGLGVLLLRFKSQWSLLLLMYLGYFFAHVLIFWRGAFASGGYYHFLMPMVPFWALLGVMAFDKLFAKQSRWRTIISGVILALIVWQGLQMIQHQMTRLHWNVLMAQDKQPGFKFISDETNLGFIAMPMRQDATNGTVIEAAKWIEQNYPSDTFSYSQHIGHEYYFFGQSIYRKGVIEPYFASPEELPSGSLFLWEANYAQNMDLGQQWGWENFENNPHWQLEKTWTREEKNYPEGKIHVAVFRKVQ